MSCFIASMYAFNAESLLVGGVHELLLEWVSWVRIRGIVIIVKIFRMSHASSEVINVS